MGRRPPRSPPFPYTTLFRSLSAYLAPLMTRESRGLLAAAIDARHGQVYLQAVAPGGRTIIAPALMGVREAVRILGSGDRKSTRLNSSHANISSAVFCLPKKQ